MVLRAISSYDSGNRAARAEPADAHHRRRRSGPGACAASGGGLRVDGVATAARPGRVVRITQTGSALIALRKRRR